MTAQAGCNRRAFLRNAGLSVGSASLLGLGLSACDSPAPERYTEADIESLAAERGREQEIKGEGEYGHHVVHLPAGPKFTWFVPADRDGMCAGHAA